ncbi:MAG TPA: hypothetical protein VHF02_03490 [Luteimonas sp.]|nr:hypothetical protein [Luteimonas sp.]
MGTDLGCTFFRKSLITKSLIAAALAASGLALSLPAHAGAASKVYLPQVEYRELEFELRGGWENFDGTDAGDGHQYVFDIGYGVTPRWFTELAVFYSKAPDAGGQIEEFKSENIILLTEPGEHWMDVGMLAEFVHNRAEGLNEIEFGPLLQKQVGREQFNLNFEFARELVDGAQTQLGYSWQWKHRGNPHAEFGLQGFGDLGAVGHLGEEHAFKLGPALFGAVRLPSGHKLKYDGAVLFGATDDAPDTTLRFQLEYELPM